MGCPVHPKLFAAFLLGKANKFTGIHKYIHVTCVVSKRVQTPCVYVCGDSATLSNHDQTYQARLQHSNCGLLLTGQQAEEAVSAHRAGLQQSNCG